MENIPFKIDYQTIGVAKWNQHFDRYCSFDTLTGVIQGIRCCCNVMTSYTCIQHNAATYGLCSNVCIKEIWTFWCSLSLSKIIWDKALNKQLPSPITRVGSDYDCNHLKNSSVFLSGKLGLLYSTPYKRHSIIVIIWEIFSSNRNHSEISCRNRNRNRNRPQPCYQVISLCKNTHKISTICMSISLWI